VEEMVFVECVALTAFEAAIIAKLGATAATDFFTDVGHRLAAARSISAAEVPSASAGSGAAMGLIGSIKAKCHGMAAAVHWHKAAIDALPAE
jgi:hypothetical protein